MPRLFPLGKSKLDVSVREEECVWSHTKLTALPANLSSNSWCFKRKIEASVSFVNNKNENSETLQWTHPSTKIWVRFSLHTTSIKASFDLNQAVDRMFTIATLRILLFFPFSTFHCISLHFSAFFCISLNFSEFLWISLHFSAFFLSIPPQAGHHSSSPHAQPWCQRWWRELRTSRLLDPLRSPQICTMTSF